MKNIDIEALPVDLVTCSLEPFGWENIHSMTFSSVDNLNLEIEEMEPTMVPSLLLDQAMVNCVMMTATVNDNEEVIVVRYSTLSGVSLGNACFYKRYVAYEQKTGDEPWNYNGK